MANHLVLRRCLLIFGLRVHLSILPHCPLNGRPLAQEKRSRPFPRKLQKSCNLALVRRPYLEHFIPRFHETLFLESIPNVNFFSYSDGSSQFWPPITSVFSATGESISCPVPETTLTKTQIFDLNKKFQLKSFLHHFI